MTQEEEKPGDVVHPGASLRNPSWEELKERAKTDTSAAKVLEAAEMVMQENREVLQRLADS